MSDSLARESFCVDGWGASLVASLVLSFAGLVLVFRGVLGGGGQVSAGPGFSRWCGNRHERRAHGSVVEMVVSTRCQRKYQRGWQRDVNGAAERGGFKGFNTQHNTGLKVFTFHGATTTLLGSNYTQFYRCDDSSFVGFLTSTFG